MLAWSSVDETECSALIDKRGGCVPDIQEPVGYLSELVFPSSHSTRLKRAPLQGIPRCDTSPKDRVGIFGEGFEILD